MHALEEVRSPLTICVEHLQQTAGPAASGENAVSLAVKLLSEQSTLQSCSQIILRDIGLTLRLLRIANSAMFNPGGKTITSVTHAAAMLGTDALAQVVDTVPRHKLNRPARELVALSQLSGVMARSLMGRMEPRYAEEAFICGLFRNIGELCYALEMPEEYQRILRGSHRNLVGLRAACRSQAHFDFDELAAGLLHHWAFYGAPVLAAQSTPEALYAQHGNPEAEIALAASLAHVITSAYFRAESAERENVMRSCWGPLVKLYHMRDAQVESLCNLCIDSLETAMEQMELTRACLRLKAWIPEEPEPEVVAKPLAMPPGSTMASVLDAAIAKGVDRAAWLPYADAEMTVGDAAGDGWPSSGAGVLADLLHPRKPPFLLAFAQHQDVWIDLARDNRFRMTPLAMSLQPEVFFLLPVHEGRKVRGCLYFDWIARRDFAPETLLPALASLRDFVTTNIPGG